MVIRQTHMEALSNARFERFVARMRDHLTANFSADLASQGVHADPPSALDQFVRSGIRKAERHGIQTEVDVQSFLEIQATVGASFDEDARLPWAGPILNDEALSGASKIDEINQHLLFGAEGPR